MGAVAFAGLFSMVGAGIGLTEFTKFVPDMAALGGSLAFWYYLFSIYLQALLTPEAVALLMRAYIVYAFGFFGVILRAIQYWKSKRKEEKIEPIPYEF